MVRFAARSVAAALALSLAAPVCAAPVQDMATTSAENESDARCVVALMSVVDQVPEEQQGNFKATAMYFTGKLIGRNGQDGTITILKSAFETVPQSEYMDIVGGCARELMALGQVLVQAGQE
ncbi:hypothetical protein [Stakelama tenebrarum]|uniref:Rap1a immunity protein domain-containing protein n=1 Tax=Stakelama tenebrarum TaxID=2711215 RepID=A0A6G6Y165_9SPHN|nr:hypothetical protein [Sphingosinithalassobacter tenebrarum]QIG78650.1 hypothetical protein G5C33_01845 [Sphingosinithalassobacter tenebrarum]